MYHPEPYWDEVARQISNREIKIVAGDDEPFYRYKRKKFLQILNSIDFRNKKVVELGPGPGGNLFEICKHQPLELVGIDISEEMVKVASVNLAGLPIKVIKVDGTHFPFADKYFDISITSTVLQHNTDELMLHHVIKELCRISGPDIYIFEKIEKKIRGTALCLGRPVDYYRSIFKQSGYELNEVKFLKLSVSQVFSGVVRKLFNSSKRKEGEPVSSFTNFSQRIFLPVTSIMDNFLFSKREGAMLHFKRKD